MTGIAQLALSVQLPDDETFESFKSSENLVIIAQLKTFIDNAQPFSTSDVAKNNPCSFYLFGSEGSGKSHLLHACSAYAAKLDKTSVCLSFSELTSLPVAVLDGLEHIDLICLDDLHLIAGDSEWQTAIFDLYNRVFEQGNNIIITGNETAIQLNVTLPDLISRLSWGFTEQIKSMSDDEKMFALQYRAKQRGVVLPDDVAKFLLNRLSRNMNDLIAHLDRLDKASIREQRKITIPFIKDVLNIDAN
jgi:DnaA family protein